MKERERERSAVPLFTYRSATALARLGWLLPESSLISFAMSPIVTRGKEERCLEAGSRGFS